MILTGTWGSLVGRSRWFARLCPRSPARGRSRSRSTFAAALVWGRRQTGVAAAALQALLDEAATDFEAAIRDAAVPCLLYCGTGDRADAQIRAAAERLPHAAFVAVEGLDHVQGLARSDRVVPHARAFLERAEAAGAG